MTTEEHASLAELAAVKPDDFAPDQRLDDAFKIVATTSAAGWHWFLDNRVRYPQADRPWCVTCSYPEVGRLCRLFHQAFHEHLNTAICQAALLALSASGVSPRRTD